jgi:hypothetical protein
MSANDVTVIEVDGRTLVQIAGPPVDENGLTHGPAGYNRGCRCEFCDSAARARNAAGIANRRESKLPAGDKRHGTANGYQNWYCRCPACSAAGAAKNQADNARRKRQRDAAKRAAQLAAELADA